ncbi:dexamethasone-induced Ras-related protein 1-like [Antedon mediterranea]|uniref:dexamethasone-induced Ras-related protein 1-like n=1 Tax=Antedon mediterranea TaxID=105859 RepID=UPI003AF629EE
MSSSSSPDDSPSRDSDIEVPPDNCFRLVVLGSPKVGKTAIVNRFLTGRFEDQYTPTIEDFHRKIYKIKGQVYRLDILDTSGNNPFPAMCKLSILTGDIFIIVYSIDNKNTFQEAVRLKDQIIETKVCNGGAKSVPMVIAANKCDKEACRAVSSEEAAKGFETNNKRCSFIETSAKKSINIDTLFRLLFENAKLPSEMSPSLHRKMSASNTPTLKPKENNRLTFRRRLSEACGIVSPNARRPSVRSDLLQMRLKLSQRSLVNDEGESSSSTGRKIKKVVCCIQ